MPRESILAALSKGKVLVSDGAWGTLLFQKGLKPGQCPELWNADRPQDIEDVARRYAEAGAHMVSTNSFGGNRFKLAHFGLSERTIEIGKKAAELSRRGAGDDVWVLGSLGPTGKMLIMEEVTGQELYDAFAEQAQALEKGGADAILAETMSDCEEACLAVKAARENTALEVLCTFTFAPTVQGGYRTMMGVSPHDAALAAVEAGAHIIGANCGEGCAHMLPIIREMRAACPAVPILVQSNAGRPEHRDGADVFPQTPEEMADFVPAFIEAGANIIGGCCGTTPAHIRAIRKRLEER